VLQILIIQQTIARIAGDCLLALDNGKKSFYLVTPVILAAVAARQLVMIRGTMGAPLLTVVEALPRQEVEAI